MLGNDNVMYKCTRTWLSAVFNVSRIVVIACFIMDCI